MATTSIPWNDGPGNIVLTYTGQGNGTVVVTSDTDNYNGQRSQQVTFVVQDGAIREDVATASGHYLRTSDGHTLTCLDRAMKVTVTVIQQMSSLHVLVTSNDHALRTISGNVLRTATVS